MPSYNVRHLSPVLAVPNLEVPSEVSVLRGLVHQLVDVCQSNQQQLSLLRGEVSQLRDELRAVRAAPVPSSQAASVHHTRVPTRVSGAPHSQSDAACPTSLCQVSSAILPRPARVRDARCARAAHPVVPGSAVGMGAPQWCPGLALAGSAKPIARASVADCIEALSVPPVDVVKSRHQVVWWACARRIAIIPNAALLPPRLFPPPFPDVIRLVICRHRSCTRSATFGNCILHCSSSWCQFHHASPTGLGREPDE